MTSTAACGNHRITAEMLEPFEPCSEQITCFRDEWPDGAEVTMANIVRAQELNLRTSWIIKHVLRDPAWAEYERVCDSAWAEYERVCDSAWAEYKHVRDPAFVRLWHEQCEAEQMESKP